MNTENDEQKKPAVRRNSHILMKGLFFFLVCSGILVILIYSPIFVLRDIHVEGNQNLSKEEITKIAGVYMGEQLFRLETGEVTKRLMQDLRIEEVIVRRDLPSSLDITIRERVPMATLAFDYGYLDIDRRGKVIDSYRTLKNMQIPMITGVQVRDIYIGDDVKNRAVEVVLEFLQHLNEEALNQISEVAIVNDTYIVAYTTQSVQIRLGELQNMEEKARLTEDFLRDLKKNPHKVEYVDFNYETPFIKFKQ